MKLPPPWIIAPLLLAGSVHAQENVIPGLDLRLSAMRSLEVLGRSGPYPDGLNGLALETTVCNTGSVEIEWHQPMNEHHPKIAFLVAAVREGRIVQLSNRSWVKHGFFALNGRSCSPCEPPAVFGEYLGIGCSDTYATSNNGDSFYLGPPDEVNPWLGSWDKVCSHFDRGYPDVGAPENCDGRRSLTHQMGGAIGPVLSRVQVSDEDLIIGGDLYCQGHYVVEGLLEAGRDDALGSRPFQASWGGNRWDLAPSGPLLAGTVLQRWPDATLSSATNGTDDGRVYAAVKVSGPVDGFYHYEYALHNRDNARGVGSLRIPLCGQARLRDVGFRDIDTKAENDWTFEREGGELVFHTGPEPLRWNTIYNFWFDSDAAPEDGALTLGAHEPGPGASAFAVSSQVPSLLMSVYLGPGCALDAAPTLYPYGAPALARIGNTSFGLASSRNTPFQPNVLYAGFSSGERDFHGCTVWTGTGQASVVSVVVSDADGIARHPCPIPDLIALEGKAFRAQAVGRDPGNGPLFQSFELSEGLLVRLGNDLPACP